MGIDIFKTNLSGKEKERLISHVSGVWWSLFQIPYCLSDCHRRSNPQALIFNKSAVNSNENCM